MLAGFLFFAEVWGRRTGGIGDRGRRMGGARCFNGVHRAFGLVPSCIACLWLGQRKNTNVLDRFLSMIGVLGQGGSAIGVVRWRWRVHVQLL